MSREKQIEDMAEMLEIIEKAREIYANDITDHTENEYIREGLLDAGYCKQSEGEFEKIGYDDFHCTHCGKVFSLGSTATIYDVRRLWKYCPNCGAKMKGGE